MTGAEATAETTLCRIFTEVLGVPVTGQDPFFDVGGDSVLALQVVARARDAGLVCNVRDVFDQQTAALLATVTTELAPATAGANPVADQAADRPMLSYAADEFGDFDDFDDAATDDIETGWETVP